MKYFVILISFSFLTTLLISCHSNLSEKQAETLIRQHDQLPQPEIKYIDLSNEFERQTTDYFYPKTNKTVAEASPTKVDSLAKLEQAGLIDYTINFWTESENWHNPSTKDYKIIVKNWYHAVSLTNKGKRYAQADGHSIILDTLDFGGITGIEMNGPDQAKVNYSVVRNRITPFGQASGVIEETLNKSVSCKKEGIEWKISEH